jgi:hypothetical protein
VAHNEEGGVLVRVFISISSGHARLAALPPRPFTLVLLR